MPKSPLTNHPKKTRKAERKIKLRESQKTQMKVKRKK